MNVRRLGALACAAVLTAVPAIAQTGAAQTAQTVPMGDLETRPKALPVPPKLAAPAITLAEAVDLTIHHDPQVLQSAASLRAAIGRRQEVRGVFDYRLRSAPGLTFTHQELTPAAKRRESDQRAVIQTIGQEFESLTTALRTFVNNASTAPPRCPSGLSFDTGSLVLDRTDPTELALLGVSSTIRPVIQLNLERDIQSINLSSICSTQPTTLLAPDAFVGVFRQIDQSGGLGLNGILTSVAQISRESRLLESQITQAISSRAKIAFDRLGPIPSEDLLRNASFDIGLARAFRNGMTFDASFQAQSQEHHFVDKPLDPAFGGQGIPTEFLSTTTVNLNVPLGRGRGGVSTAAPERVADFLLAGQREQVRHDVSEEVFRTVLSYLNLIAAQDSLAVLEESAARQVRILQLSNQQVAAGDLPRAQLGRAQARAASVDSSVSQARAAVQSARVALAETIGVDVDSLQLAPMATETFAAIPATPDAVASLEAALAARHDARAAMARRNAAAALTAGAEADRRPRFDLSFSAGFSNLYDSPFFKFLPDEADTIINSTNPVPVSVLTGTPIPPLSPVRYYSAKGYYRVVSGRYEPFVSVNLKIELPFGNHAAKGRAMQARATLEQSTTDVVDLHRVIGENIISTGQTLRRSAAAVTQWLEAVTQGQRTLDSALQRFQTRDIALIDALLTEEGLTGDKLQLIRQRQNYLSTLARLKFEAGDIVLFDRAGTTGEIARFLPVTFVAR